MVGSSRVGDKVRFGPFEADLRTGELRKLGIRIKLQGQPFKVLALLIEHAGEIVSREDLQREIWGPLTVVDFDRGIGTAVNKVRESLCDSADTPRYIETIARRGYRFIADVQPVTQPVASSKRPEMPESAKPLTYTPPAETEMPAQPPRSVISQPASPDPGFLEFSRGTPWRIPVLCALLALALWGAWTLGLRMAHNPLVQFNQVTWSEHVYPGDSALERYPAVATDGLNVFFPEMRDRNLVLSVASVRDGDARPVLMPAEIVRPSVADISPDGTRLLVLSMTWVEPEHPLWIVPSHGGAARKVPNALAHDATWLPDGESILFASSHDLVIARSDGTAPRKLATLPARPFWIRYSPDGSTIRLTLRDPRTGAGTLWEMTADGSRIHPLLPGWRASQNECCGSWTAEGDYVFQAVTKGVSDIWLRREASHGPWSASEKMRQLTAGPLSYLSPVPDRRGHRVFVIGTHSRNQLMRFDPVSRQLSRMAENISNAAKIEFSRDGSHVAWISSVNGMLWQSLQDGSQRLQLTSGPMRVIQMRWSPDGRRLAFVAQNPGEPLRIYTVAADGGHPEMLLNEPHSQIDASWSPDGESIVFGRSPQYVAEDTAPKEICIVHLKTRAMSVLPGSRGLFSPRWSPDGRYIAALPLNQRRLTIFDRRTGEWQNVASQSINNPSWCRDGDCLYFQSSEQEDQPIYRVWLKDKRLERVVDFRSLREADKVAYLGLSPDDSPIVSLRFATADIYSVKYQ